MQFKKALALCISIGISNNMAHAFFWVPNRYTAPFWSGDTHITNHFINSCDVYIGSSYTNTKNNDYHTVDGILTWYQTIAAGFFCEATMPITTIIVHEPSLLKPLDNGLCYENCSILAGWGINHDAVPILDFIDCMFRIGVTTPAHTPLLQESCLESLYGYPTWGIPLSSDLAIGLCNWMTFGFHMSICQFNKNPLVWHVQPYFKADHFLIGLSGWFGYSYTGATNDTGSQILFANKEVWHMHTLHYGLEYEFIQSYFPLHPRVGAYYNQCLSGIHTLLRSNVGITAGFDVTW